MITNNGNFKAEEISALMDPVCVLQALETAKESIIPSPDELIWCVKKGKVDRRDFAIFKICLDYHQAKLAIKLGGKGSIERSEEDEKLKKELNAC